MKFYDGYKFYFTNNSSDFAINLSFNLFSIITEGNKSFINALNNGKSSFKNFGIFESLNAFISNKDSYVFGSDFFNNPAFSKTLLTARIPKS